MEDTAKAAEKKCPRCEKNKAEPPHPCPYKAEINDDHESLCECCSECRYECCMEI